MKTITKYIFILFLIADVEGYSQDIYVDTIAENLIQKLEVEKSDAVRLVLLNQIGDRYLRIRNVGQLKKYSTLGISKAEKLLKENSSEEVSENRIKISLAISTSQYGYYYVLIQKYDSALFYFQKILATSVSPDDEISAIANKYLGITYTRQIEFKLAHDCLEKSLSNFKRLNNKQDLGDLYLDLAELEFRKSLFENSLSYCRLAKDLKTELKDSVGLIETEIMFARNYVENSNYSEASRIFDIWLPYFKSHHDEYMVAIITYNMGNILLYRGKYNEAIEMLQQSFNIAEAIGDYYIMAASLSSSGVCHKQKGELEMALSDYYSVLKICELHPNKIMEGSNYSNIGSVQRRQMKYKDAVESNLKAKTILNESGNECEYAAACNNLAIVYKYTKDMDKSLKNYQEAYRVFSKLKLKKEAARCALNIAASGNAAVNTESRLKYYQIADSLYRDLKDSANLAEVYFHKGILLQSEKRYVEAIAEHNKALSIYQAVNKKDGVAGSYINIGVAYLSMSNYNPVEITPDSCIKLGYQYIQRGLKLAQELKIAELIQFGYENLFIAEVKLGESENAIDHYKLLMAYNDSLFNVEKSKQITEINTKYETDRKDKEIKLLNNEKEIQVLRVKQQEAELLNYKLVSSKKQDEISLLNKDNEIKSLQLTQAQKDLMQRSFEAKAKAAELEVIRKDNVINDRELQKQKIIKNGFIVGIILVFILGLLVINRIQLRKKIEKQNAILEERRRISNDMHDDLGSNLSKITLLSEMLERNLTDEKEKNELGKISSSARDALNKMSEIVWTLNSKNDTLENLLSYIRKYVMEYFESTNIECKVQLPNVIPDKIISGEQRRNIFLSMKEALHNIVRHSDANRVDISFVEDNGNYELRIQDNGKGINPEKLNRFGNGMQNMKQRMEAINGKFKIENKAGTSIKLLIPIT